MPAYYQVRMREGDTKFTAFQAPNVTKNRRSPGCATRDILRENKLFVKLSECVFCTEEIPCLEDFVGRNGARMDPEKVYTMKGWPNKRNAKVHFSDKLLKSFKELKRRLCNPPVLQLPDFNQSMHFRADASKFAVGGVSFQVVNGVEHPFAYTSRKMKSVELNYPTQHQELLAIVNALAAFRIYSLDKPLVAETDHKSLEGLFIQKMVNRRGEYKQTFSYLPGAKNGVSDSLR
ncbi:Putative retroelement [Phytophthora palmivora]|uniref:Retroelement n=1 Tax=Phytophthora palmivora TaxID=4796 RepID=A0A2P4YN23_9STRA|nr:Putative retroelement [Phytophthora palmivora]